MDYKEKVIALLNDNTLSLEQRKQLEYIFPELAESEDERIRKEIIDIVSAYRSNCVYEGTHHFDDCLAWLEKQKEPKWSPSEGEMGVLYKLCYISNQITDEDDTELTRLYQDLKREYFNGHSFENMFSNEKQKEQKNYNKLYEDIAKSEWFKKAYHNKSLGDCPFVIDELEESEDERMYKAISIALSLDEAKRYLKSWHITPEEAISWLEKQKDKMTAEEYEGSELFQLKLKTKYANGYQDGLAQKEQKPVKPSGKLSRQDYLYQLLINQLITYSDYEYLIGQKPAKWSEKYIADVFEKVGLAKIVREQGNDGLTNALQAAMIELSKIENTEWSEEDIKKIRSEEYTKGFNDAAFGGNLKEWSVEDEDRIRQIERIAQQAGCTQKLQEEIHDWLKSLRPSWKPSDK